MSKRYKIRWTESDNRELKKAVKNFNAKLTRLEKKNPEIKNALPERRTVKQMRELITTRNDLNRELNALKRFSHKGMEKIVVIPGTDNNIKATKWEKEEITRRIGIINRKRKKRLDFINELELTDRGQPLGYTAGQVTMGKTEKLSLEPMVAFTPKMSRTGFRKKSRNVFKESQEAYWNWRDALLKENYIQSLEENFNPKDIKKIIKAIDRLSFEEFYKIFRAEGGNFELNYPPNAEEYAAYLEGLYAIWQPNKKMPKKIKGMPKKKKGKGE